MQPYLDLLQHVLDHGHDKPDRTGTGTRSVFGRQLRFDLADGLPLVTTRKIHTRTLIVELLWFIAGGRNNNELRDQNVTIWDEWADPDTGDLGPIYGHQWRRWPINPADPDAGHVDQLQQVITSLRDNPHSRRHIVSAWNVAQLDDMALPPCHTLFQFYVTPPQSQAAAERSAASGTDTDPTKPRLSCQLYQRSGDLFLGVPYNIAGYSLLTCMIAHTLGYTPGDFVHTLGDAHIYDNHRQQVDTLLRRTPRALPTVHLNPQVISLFDFTPEDITIRGYDPHPPIKAAVAV
ncbi:MAG: thymidylate synthase [Planctomycetota bacterium]